MTDKRIQVSVDGEDPFIIDDAFEKLVREFLVNLEDMTKDQ